MPSSEKWLQSIASKEFNIEPHYARQVFESINKTAFGDPSQNYKFIGYNCHDFTQNHFRLAGLEGKYIDHLEDTHSTKLLKFNVYERSKEIYINIALPYLAAQALVDQVRSGASLPNHNNKSVVADAAAALAGIYICYMIINRAFRTTSKYIITKSKDNTSSDQQPSPEFIQEITNSSPDEAKAVAKAVAKAISASKDDMHNYFSKRKNKNIFENILTSIDDIGLHRN